MRTIFIILAIFIGLRLLGRLLAPWIMRKASSRLQRMAEEQMKQRGFSHEARTQKPPGTVTVEKTSNKSSSQSKSTEGDYVDFEEVD